MQEDEHTLKVSSACLEADLFTVQVYGRGASPGSVSQLYGPSYCMKLFAGLPKSSLPTELTELAHTAFKFAMKLALGKDNFSFHIYNKQFKKKQESVSTFMQTKHCWET